MCWTFDTICGGTLCLYSAARCPLSRSLYELPDVAWLLHFATCLSPLLLRIFLDLATLRTTNSSPKSPFFSQRGKKGKFLLFKMAVHNPSMEHKRVCRSGKMDGGPNACLHKKVFNPSSRSSSQGSMILKTGTGLGKRNGSAGKFKSTKGVGHYAKQGSHK